MVCPNLRWRARRGSIFWTWLAICVPSRWLIDSCITQLKAQGPSRTCNESKEEEKEGWEKPEVVVVVGTLVSSGTLRYVSVLISGSRFRVQSLVLVSGPAATRPVSLTISHSLASLSISLSGLSASMSRFLSVLVVVVGTLVSSGTLRYVSVLLSGLGIRI